MAVSSNQGQSVKDAVRSAAEELRKSQRKEFELSDAAKILGLTPTQIKYAAESGRLSVEDREVTKQVTVRVPVVSANDLLKFAESQLMLDRNGKPRIRKQ